MSRITVVGGTGRIGTIVTALLTRAGHEVIVASPSSGVDAATGAGLARAVRGAQVVVDVSKPNTYENEAVLAYFSRAATRLAEVEREAGVGHHVLLTTVGAREPHGIGFYAAKVAAEDIVRDSGIPFTLIRSTQFFEFFGTIADTSMHDGVVRLPRVLVRPIAGQDAGAAIVRAAMGMPRDGEFEIAGPEQLPLDEFVRRGLAACGDPRLVVRDPDADYFGGHPGERTLLPGTCAQIFPTRFDDWLDRHTVGHAAAGGRSARRAAR